MKKYQFSGLIKCIDCGYNFRGKMQRKNPHYICSGYNNSKSKCNRFSIPEKDIIDAIERHFIIHKRNIEVGKEFRDYIKKIEVYNSKRGYVIRYKSGETSILMPNRIKF